MLHHGAQQVREVLVASDKQRIIAMVCGTPPTGAARWTVRLIAEEAVKRQIVPRVGRETIRILLQSYDLKPWREKTMWCLAELTPAYIANMEEVLAVYERPYDPQEPVVCLDEKPRCAPRGPTSRPRRPPGASGQTGRRVRARWDRQHRRHRRTQGIVCRAYEIRPWQSLFVRLDLFDEDQAAGMLTWPHSGFHVHTAVWVPEDDRAFATRLARYCARNPVALERLTYDRVAKVVTYRSDKSEARKRPPPAPRPPMPWSFSRGCSPRSPTRGRSPRGTTGGTPTARVADAAKRSPPRPMRSRRS